MNQTRFPPEVCAGIILALFFSVALYLRVYLPYDHVFSGDWIKFSSVDAYYHMRLVDNLLHHFPQHITFDPYTFYPHGHTIGWPPFFYWLLAGIIWLVGLGTPTEHVADVIGVYFPAVLGALTVIPVYFIGKVVFNRWAGVLSAGLIALLPGEFLNRSTLGFTDHHVAETLFTTVFILFLILAIKSARQRQLTLNCLKGRDWAITRKPLIYGLLAGISLGIYLLTWVGGLLFVFLIFIYFIIQFIIDHLRGENTDYLAIVGTLCMVTALIISLPIAPQTSWLGPLYLPSFIIVTLTPLALVGISRLFTNNRIKPVYYPLSLFGLGLTGLAVFHIINPSLLKSMLSRFSIFTPAGATVTILEAQPLLFPKGSFSLSTAWSNFTTGFFLSLVAIGILIYLVVKHGSADKTLLVVWSLLMLAATLGQRRFGYYLAVNVALLTGYLSWQIIKFTGFKKMIARPVEIPKMTKKKKAMRKKPPRMAGITNSYISAALGMVVVFFLVFFPNIGPAVSVAKYAHFAPDDAWYEALSWLKEETPDPFGKPDFYYEVYKLPPPGESYKYPETAYGVLAWWDYGHWITRIAHRIPVTNPFQQGVSSVARFFTAQDEASATKIIERLGVRYVIVDKDVATDKFRAIATSAGSSHRIFLDIYYKRQGGKVVPVILFHPEYYRTLSVRLYSFDGEAVVPEHSTVISYEERVSREGVTYKLITGSQSFPTDEKAIAHISRQTSGNHKIVSDNPFVSPISMERLKHYRLIYDSKTSVGQMDVRTDTAIKIFEYRK